MGPVDGAGAVFIHDGNGARGTAAGAGFGLALATDLRFAAKGTKFTMAFSKIGLIPDSGSSYFLSRLVGVGRALEWAWTAEVLTAETLFEHSRPAFLGND